MSATFTIPGIPDAIGKIVNELPDHLEDAVSLLPFWQAKQDELLLRIPYVGSFRATHGITIEVAPVPSVDQATIDIYLHGTVRAALIQQRGEVALHAACLSPPDQEIAVCICGVSGAGKSTLAAELCRRGWKLLTDDLTRVECTSGTAIAWPADENVHLWKDACDSLGFHCADFERVRRGVDRFIVKMVAETKPLPLRLVLDLRYRETGLMRVTSPMERMIILNRHVFRRKQIAALAMQAQHGTAIMQLAAVTTAGILHGSRTDSIHFLADQVVEALSWIQR